MKLVHFLTTILLLSFSLTFAQSSDEAALDPNKISLGLPGAQYFDSNFNVLENKAATSGMQVFNHNTQAREIITVGEGNQQRYMYMAYINSDGPTPFPVFKKGAGILFTGGFNGMNLISTRNDIRFITGGLGDQNQRFVIKQNGCIGVNTQDPRSKLQITDGDVYIDNMNSGVIMTAPDGSCWRMTMANGGTIVTDSIACP